MEVTNVIGSWKNSHEDSRLKHIASNYIARTCSVTLHGCVNNTRSTIAEFGNGNCDMLNAILNRYLLHRELAHSLPVYT